MTRLKRSHLRGSGGSLISPRIDNTPPTHFSRAPLAIFRTTKKALLCRAHNLPSTRSRLTMGYRLEICKLLALTPCANLSSTRAQKRQSAIVEDHTARTGKGQEGLSELVGRAGGLKSRPDANLRTAMAKMPRTPRGQNAHQQL